MWRYVYGFVAGAGLAVAVPAITQTITFQKWQDMGKYVGQLAEKVNTHTAEIAALKADHALMIGDTANIISNYDAKLRFELALVCDYNSKVPTWQGVLLGLKPIALGSLVCPPAGSKFYQPNYISKDGPPIPE